MGCRSLTILISGSILLQVCYVWCKVIPSRDDAEVPKFAPVSILPEIEEEEFLEDARRLDQDGAHVMRRSRVADRFRSRSARSPEGSEPVQFPDGVEAEPPQTPDPPTAASPAASAPSPAPEPATATAAAASAEADQQAAATHQDPAKAAAAGGSLRAGGGGGGSGGGGLPFSGLIPQGLPSLPGLPLGGGGGADGAAAIQQNVPTLFLGSFQLLRMPMPSMGDLVSMMQAGASLFQGAPNFLQGAPNLFQGLPSLPGLPAGGST